MPRTLTRLALLVAGCVSLAASGQQAGDHAHHAPLPMDGVIGEIDVDFELLDRAGELVRDEDFRGRYILLAFGFTRCETVCPLLAFSMGQALEATSEDAVGIFVSVDTERDTVEMTDRYAAGFSERMIGLGGDYERINAVTGNFNVNYAVTKTRDSYVVQHTANIYLIGPDGALRDVFAVNATPDMLVDAMQ